ncbi:MAG: hypothetical protein P794_07245 [Epsilonproteobacteria bacterium (ex Lamellibrachia satsuma)]|nr:MAG: hypothetical protein P794_07245 [Epsilonproteobacteria bacterium (ex Lamellibrachia satsuma)]
MLKIKKNEKKVWVTFTVVPETEHEYVEIIGSWNDWKKEKMKQKKDGSFYITKVLPLDQMYEFKYLLNGSEWVNDVDAMQTENVFGSMNSVIDI